METSPDYAVAVSPSPFTSLKGAADAANSAQEGARFLTKFWIEQGVCFTSGHVVHALREARGRSLMVNQRPTGLACQEYFLSGDMPSYDDEMGGSGSRPVRKVLVSVRTDTRTPVGTEVYVYGPSEADIDLFEFEINIAEALPMVDDGQGGQTSAATALLNATPTTPANAPAASPIPPVQPSGTVATATGKMVPGNPLAVMHQSGSTKTPRLTVPRIAFEALAFETGEPVKGGEPVYVTFAGNILTISQTCPPSGSVVFRPTTDRLRLHLPVPGNPPVGTNFEILVGQAALTINLGNPQ